MTQTVTISRAALWIVVLLLALIVLSRSDFPVIKASADSARFDYIHVVSPLFLYQGKQGLLLMDKRNGNIWFIGKEPDDLNLKYGDPVFITKVPLEKLDENR
jgi:hypothetical protein